MGKTEYLLITIIFNFIFVLFIAAIISYVWQYKRKKREHVFAIQNQEDLHLKELLAMQVEMQEKTMQEIGREIHDNIGQKLTLASLYIQNLLYENKKNESGENIENISTIINESLADLRQLSKTLTDDSITTKSVVALLQNECQKITKLKKCWFTYDAEIQSSEVTYHAKSMLLRIAQEFIQNSLKHANCKSIKLNLKKASGYIIMELVMTEKALMFIKPVHSELVFRILKKEQKTLAVSSN